MNNFYSDFPITNQKQWLEKVEKDLKGKTIEDTLHHFHPIEEIDYQSYGLHSDEQKHSSAPGQPPYLRGGKSTDNDWINNVVVPVDTPKKMNQFALNQLMNGATGLTLDLTTFDKEESNQLIHEIGFAHIVVTFIYASKEQFEWLQALADKDELHGTAFCSKKEQYGQIKGLRNQIVAGIDVQYAGGNIKQEIAYALHQGHQLLYKVMNKNEMTIDEAASQIKFKMGIGSSYFFEISKFRVLRSLWYTIVQSYQPKASCSSIAYIEAETGFINKSLKDPHTNLLRQTTEALSAVLGGVDELTIRPYDAWSNQPEQSKTQRLGLNIALLLKEESYMDKVIDPVGGSYCIEKITQTIKLEAWELFQELEGKGSDFLQTEVKKTAAKRVELIKNNNTTLIGVNNYFNDKPSSKSWKINHQTPFGKPLVLEQKCTIKA